ncbi:MAG: Gfo/Idh/MocA family oxidoreductase [Firmicutes bacterium]|jgi:predicted dehydrogenase|nr:Gfo/Idh/MocA family oxidoreductase [Bacillota bacterium]
MSKKLRVGIVGVGGIANGKHMPSLAKLDNVEMVAFCDVIKERAEKGAQQYGTPNAKVFTDYRDLVALEDLDVVHVLTPNDVHSEITVAALEAGKHVMCEKPMAINSEQALAMVEAAERTGKKLTIGYQNRFRPDSQYLKKLCDAGDLGEIYFAKALAIRRRGVPTWGIFLNAERQGGGPLIDIGTHALDLTLWLTNNYKPVSVMGVTYRKLAETENAANPWGPWDPKEFTTEDSAFGFVQFENGMTVILESSWALNTLQVGEAMTVLCGTKAGADMLDGLRINGEKFSKLYTTKPAMHGDGVAFYEAAAQDAGAAEAKSWIDSIINDTEPLVKPREAYVVTQILEAIYESAKTGKPVYFDDNCCCCGC